MVQSVLQVSSLYLVSYLHRYVIWSSTLPYRSFALPSSLSSLHLRPSSLKMVLKILTVTYCTSFPAHFFKITSQYKALPPSSVSSLTYTSVWPFFLCHLSLRCTLDAKCSWPFDFFFPSLVLSGAYSFQHQISLSSSLCSLIKPNTILAVFFTTTDCISITYWLLYLKYIVVVYRDKTTKTVSLGNKPWL